jgi:flagellin FlaB
MTFNRESAFTGLEAAIVLIAFVVVAAVFSYVVRGAGFFTTQKSQEVVHTGVAQASSNMMIIGDVYGDATNTYNDAIPNIESITFTVGLAAGGSPVDLNKTLIMYQNKTILQKIDYGSTLVTPGGSPGPYQWMIIKQDGGNANALLELGEQFTIKVELGGTMSTGLIAYDQFNLEIKPDIGAALGIKRTAPAGIDPMNLLY